MGIQENQKARLLERVEIGAIQSRILESTDPDDPEYLLYNSAMFEHDLQETLDLPGPENRQKRRTADPVDLLKKGDVVFSLVHSRAALVSKETQGSLMTQNFIRLIPAKDIDSQYLVYLINEDGEVGRQIQSFSSGTKHARVSKSGLEKLEVSSLPEWEKQKRIGEIYMAAGRLRALRERQAQTKESLIIGMLKGVK